MTGTASTGRGYDVKPKTVQRQVRKMVDLPRTTVRDGEVLPTSTDGMRVALKHVDTAANTDAWARNRKSLAASSVEKLFVRAAIAFSGDGESFDNLLDVGQVIAGQGRGLAVLGDTRELGRAGDRNGTLTSHPANGHLCRRRAL